jgi:hypothetical protein
MGNDEMVGEPPSGYYVLKSRTYGVWLVARTFLINLNLWINPTALLDSTFNQRTP